MFNVVMHVLTLIFSLVLASAAQAHVHFVEHQHAAEFFALLLSPKGIITVVLMLAVVTLILRSKQKK